MNDTEKEKIERARLDIIRACSKIESALSDAVLPFRISVDVSEALDELLDLAESLVADPEGAN